MQKKLIHSKILIVLLSSLLLALIVGTYMWVMHEIEVENILQSSTVNLSIEETVPSYEITPGDVTKEVSFKNTGTASVFLRFTYAQTWETEHELLIGYQDSTTLNWQTNLSDDWYLGDDGWYYYKKVVAANSAVAILNSVTFPDTLPEDANYNLFFQVETVQASDQNAVNKEATTQLFGVAGTVSDSTISNGAVTSGTVNWGDANE